ncbi:MAG: hypothetical protein EB168_02595 [Euryarchaeota archaeon]|nr:hypothetical protein [Euryarchaeota archaeon]
MLDITSVIPARHKRTASGWISFNAVCCEYNGENRDRRQRGGVKQNGEDWSYHCFNCGFKASFKLGRTLGFKTRKLLNWFGVDQGTIQAINLESLKHKDMAQLMEDRSSRRVEQVKFDDVQMPEELRLLEETDTKYIKYLESRAVDPGDYPYMISPEQKGRQAERIVIPYTYEDRIVGHTARFLDDRKPKFISEQQPGYVFGTDLQQEHWTQAIVVEGIFDALSLNCLALLHNDINDKQATLLKSLRRDITVVPDQDQAGIKLIDRAVALGFAVSMPPWPDDVKDVNDAVKRYGRLGTLITIMKARETSKIKIEMAKKKLITHGKI